MTLLSQERRCSGTCAYMGRAWIQHAVVGRAWTYGAVVTGSAGMDVPGEPTIAGSTHPYRISIRQDLKKAIGE